ncbi:MAG TPA: 50S ribosomal protein L6 [Candidatus Eisenbacteria bacterium]|nr:50S ribosomal protein L6 [Candidatus Eisenbacteria bacterium]
MSKIGKLPITLKEGVTVTVVNNVATVTGPKGTLTFPIPAGITVVVENDKLQVGQELATRETTRDVFGLTRALLANMVTGVSTGIEKKLELTGVGYRAQAAGSDLTLSVGFSHPVKISAPAGTTFTVADNVITISGIDKAVVGLIASRVRAVRPPEPYKGKGIKYVGEVIRKKAGKAAKAVGAK